MSNERIRRNANLLAGGVVAMVVSFSPAHGQNDDANGTKSAGAATTQKLEKPLTFGQYKESVESVNIAKHTMTLEKFKKSVTEKNTYVLDLRDKAHYEKGHLKGALHLGSDVTSEKLAKLVGSKDATVVLYCSNSIYPTRKIALTFSVLPQVIALGYPNTFVLEPVYRTDLVNSARFTDGPLWEKGNSEQAF